MSERKWYQKKAFYVPVAIVLGLVGLGASVAILIDVDLDDELDPNYWLEREQPLFKKKS